MGVGGALILAALGCGKKAPPVAPKQAPLVAMTDLQAKVDGESVTLTWHHSPENQGAAGYIVLRAQTAITQPECPGCPKAFRKVETMGISRSQRKQRHGLTFTQTLSRDARYTFSVRPYHASGAQGPDSNLVEIKALPPDMPQIDETNH